MPYVNNSGTDQPAHPYSLISAFFVHCFESMLPILAKSKFSRLSAGLFEKKHTYFSVGHICLQASSLFYLFIFFFIIKCINFCIKVGGLEKENMLELTKYPYFLSKI